MPFRNQRNYMQNVYSEQTDPSFREIDPLGKNDTPKVHPEGQSANKMQ